MLRINTGLALLALLVCVFACKNNNETPSNGRDFIFENIDTTLSPAQDFAAYANGAWYKRFPIPASESNWGIGREVQQEIYQKMLKINEEAAAKPQQKGSNLQKIGDFFATGMDSLGIEKNGIEPIAAELTSIAQIKTIQDVLRVAAQQQTYSAGFAPLFDMTVYQDMKNSAVQALYLSQGGISMPERDYYFNNDKHSQTVRTAFPGYIQSVFNNINDKDGVAKSAAIIRIETALAKAARPLEALRDPYANYNKMAINDLPKLTPSINWNEMLQWMKVPKVDSVIIGQPEYFKALDATLKSASIEDWKAYLTFHLINAYADCLPAKFDAASFGFYKTKISGATTPRPRWKRVLDAEEDAMGDILGQLFVKEYFSAATKKRYERLVDDIMEAYKERIQKLDWMSAATKEKALYKLSKINKKVGYPDKWRDYSKLEIDRSSYVRNAVRCTQWRYQYQINKLGKPVDRTEWEMTPQTYNAYYNPSNNEIVLPAAIFAVPGVPDEQLDDAIVYAYAGGSTIGHEITHGFDDQGRLFDAEGNLSSWWTPQDSAEFVKRGNVMIKQFSDYVVLDSMHVNGEACLGENIADLGGILLAWDAFKKTEQYKSGKKTNGLTPSQRYFLGYAVSWINHQRDQRLANQIMTDVHAPAFLRINGPLANIPEFYEAFGIKSGDAMYRADSVRVKIW